MFARVIQFPLKPESVSEAVAYFQNSVGPELKKLDGFKNARILTNSDTNRGLMVTLWESEAARQGAESNGFLKDVIKHMSSYFAGPPTVDYYQVDVQVS